ncbi:MAG: hypothetical protein JRG71_10470 [Deltaproteobacteria bacterium]|nr:hypothetical protein [Deltaproteobacteria bacterium]
MKCQTEKPLVGVDAVCDYFCVGPNTVKRWNVKMGLPVDRTQQPSGKQIWSVRPLAAKLWAKTWLVGQNNGPPPVQIKGFWEICEYLQVAPETFKLWYKTEGLPVELHRGLGDQKIWLANKAVLDNWVALRHAN